MLLANNITFKRDNKTILSNLNISISPKKIIHLTGKNGAGKTTFLKILTNILQPDTGEIYWNGKNIKKNPFNFYRHLTLIMDNQTPNYNLTVNENILFWRKICNSSINDSQINSVLNLLMLEKYKDMSVNKLSYGEIKKLELTRLVIERKKLWVLDEPYIGLDQSSVDIVNETITNHAQLGGMIIFASHIKPEILNLEYFDLI